MSCGSIVPANRSGGFLIASAVLALFAGSNGAHGQVTLTEGTNFTVDVAVDGRLAIDLLGSIWILPPSGGTAESITNGLMPVRRPRWSPDAEALVYQARSPNREQLWLFRFDEQAAQKISDSEYIDQHADWHPDGERLVYSSARNGSDFDIWELDLPTRLTWRLTDLPGDESEPTWSADGRDLAYVHRLDGKWSLMLRNHGEPDQAIVTSEQRLSAPAWRPDGSLLTFQRHGHDGLSIDMVILSKPRIVRTLISGEDIFVAPVAWLDRLQFVYTANGLIRKRMFNSWTSTTVPFRATISRPEHHEAGPRPPRILPMIDEPTGQRVYRTTRLFDGIGSGYREGLDIVVDGGTITAVEGRRDRPGAIVVDLDDLTIVPGFIDSYAALPANADDSLGPLLLAFGVTTIVTDHADGARLNQRWSQSDLPGPRVLAASSINDLQPDSVAPWLVTISGDMAAGIEHRSSVAHWQARGIPVLAETWQVGLGSGAALMLGAESLPASPGGIRYQDMQLANGSGPITLISGLADSMTPDLDALLDSRQARTIPNRLTALRRFADTPALSAAAGSIVLGSKPNGLPPGVALHAEFRALAAAGLNHEQVLRAAGVNAAAGLGLGLQIGRIAVGAVADFVFVDGDPLGDINDAINVIAVVRNGRFFSTAGLIERVENVESVEIVE